MQLYYNVVVSTEWVTGMKLRATIIFLAVLLLISTIFVPDILLATIPEVGVTQLTKTVYNQYLNCSGSIEQEQKSDVTLDVPVILSRIEVEIGDYVEKGQRLAVVNKEATLSAYSNLDSAAAVSVIMGGGLSGIPDELLSSFVNSGGSSIFDFYEKNKNAIQAIPDNLKAPESGVVTQLTATENQLTTALMPIISIAQTEHLVARVAVSETNISKIYVNQRAVLSVIANGKKVYEGIVIKIYPTANRSLLSSSTDATVDVVIKILNPDQSIKPGFTTKARIVVEESREAFVLPYEVICQDDDQNEYVYVYSGGRALKRVIRTGNELLYGVEVIGGLLEKEVIVTNPERIAGEDRLVRLSAG